MSLETPPVDPAQQQGAPATQVTPTPGATDNLNAAQLTAQINALNVKLEQIEQAKSNANDEAAKRRLALRTQREQFDALAEQNKLLEAEHTQAQTRITELETELAGFREAQTRRRESLLGEMTEAHRAIADKLPLPELEAFHAELYGKRSPQPTPGGGKPEGRPRPETSIDLESAAAAGDASQINRAFDAVLAAGRQ